MTNHKFVIGLTGGIASGKSQVSSYFSDLGVDVLDSDKIARDLFSPHSEHLTPLLERYGESIFESAGVLDRKALGKIVFADSKELDWLNQFTHPLINEQMKIQLANCGSSYVILDIPLLVNKEGKIAAHLLDLIDRILVVKIEQELQLARVCERDRISKIHAEKIIATQSTMAQKLVFADEVIDNSGSLEQLKERVLRLHEYYLTVVKSKK